MGGRRYHGIGGPDRRRKVGNLTDDHCWFCGAAHAKTIDHLQPRSRGGTSCLANLVTACVDCNQRKADMTLDEYRALCAHQAGVEEYLFHGESGVRSQPPPAIPVRRFGTSLGAALERAGVCLRP